MAGSLGFGGYDGEALPYKDVHQGRFSYVGFSDDVDKSCFVGGGDHF